MNIVWNEKTAQWFADASVYTGYHKKLANILLEVLPGRGSLADLGCGTGLIDMELASHYCSITCVDISKEALAQLNSMAAARGISNINTKLCNAAELNERFDDVIAVFHGDPETFAEKYIPLAKNGFAAVVHASSDGKLGPDNYRLSKNDTAHAAEVLFAKLGIEYSRKDVSLEYGQPLRSINDAREFTRAYSNCPPESVIDDYLESHLIRTDDKYFPFYLPNEKNFSILSVLN